jgi:hypothetical protein
MLSIQKLETNKISALYMGQTDLITGQWFPIKKMTWDYIDGEYVNCITAYTNGAKILRDMYPHNPHLVGFGSLDRIRCSFANRMPLSRSPLPEKLEVLGLDSSNPDDVDPVEYVARSGGYRLGDSNDLFPEILPDKNGSYNFYFLPHSSYEFVNLRDEIYSLNYPEVGKKLHPLVSNEKMVLQYKNYIVGSIPGYITQMIAKYKDQLKINVVKVNLSVPRNYRLLCCASFSEFIGTPFTELEYQPINN